MDAASIRNKRKRYPGVTSWSTWLGWLLIVGSILAVTFAAGYFSGRRSGMDNADPAGAPCAPPPHSPHDHGEPMTTITAKVRCSTKVVQGEGDNASATVTFGADYADGANKAWSLATPTLGINMTLNGTAAALFEQGAAYTLEFVPGDSAADESSQLADATTGE
jgi:hypothetical protein